MLPRCVAPLLAIVLCLSVADAIAQPQPARRGGKADLAVSEGVAAGQRMRVIVRGRANAAWRARLAAGGRVKRHHRGIGAVVAELNARDLDALIKDPHVHAVSIDAPVRAYQLLAGDASLTSPDNPFAGYPGYDTQKLRATLGLRTTDVGTGVGIAIIDSGIAPTPDIAGRISAFYDFRNGSATAASPSDPYGHGTHVAGLIAGSGLSSSGKYVGVAPGARLIGLRVLNEHGAGYTSDVIAAVEFAIANRAALGIDVINLSLGHPIYEEAATDPLVQAVERAVRAGIVVVASAGNIGMNEVGEVGYAGVTSPGNAPSALTVGAMRHKGTASRLDDEIAMFSSRGPTWYDGLIKPDVIAPGQALVATADASSALYQNAALRVEQAGYLKLSGTSMAAGVVSGVVATIIDAKRRDQGTGAALTPNAIKAILQFTAIQLPDADAATPSALEQGTGGINAAGAIELTRAIDAFAPQGQYWLTTSVTPATLLRGSLVPMRWSQQVLWGDHAVWGDSVFTNLEAWAQHIVWGDSEDHIVWGDADHIVWGDALLHGINLVTDSILAWSDHIVWGDRDDHIVWGDGDHIVWGDLEDHIVWGDLLGSPTAD